MRLFSKLQRYADSLLSLIYIYVRIVDMLVLLKSSYRKT